MNQTLRPARSVSPGRILRRELDARGWTQKDLAEIMGRPPQTIAEIVQGTKRITPETALQLADAFGTSANFWTNLETNYRLQLATKSHDDKHIARKSRLYGLAPVSELIKRGWLDRAESLDALEESVCAFLGIAHAGETPPLAVNFRHATERGPETSARIAWLKRVEQLAMAQDIGRFDAEGLREAIPDIVSCAASASGVSVVLPLLLRRGVHVVIVPHLQKTYIDGAAFYLPDGQPVIALTLRYDRIDAFWFTLLHELAHILAGHVGIYMDDFDNGDTKTTDEEQANRQARDWLIDSHAFDAFVKQTQPLFTKAAIVQFAMSQGRHPGIVLGRLQHEGLVEYKQHRSLLTKVKPLLEARIDTA